jgi:hypothetical protein
MHLQRRMAPKCWKRRAPLNAGSVEQGFAARQPGNVRNHRFHVAARSPAPLSFNFAPLCNKPLPDRRLYCNYITSYILTDIHSSPCPVRRCRDLAHLSVPFATSSVRARSALFGETGGPDQPFQGAFQRIEEHPVSSAKPTRPARPPPQPPSQICTPKQRLLMSANSSVGCRSPPPPPPSSDEQQFLHSDDDQELRPQTPVMGSSRAADEHTRTKETNETGGVIYTPASTVSSSAHEEEGTAEATEGDSAVWGEWWKAEELATQVGSLSKELTELKEMISRQTVDGEVNVSLSPPPPRAKRD